MGIFFLCCIVGVILWGIGQTAIPPIIKTVIYVIVAVLLIVWCANKLGYGISLR